MGLSISNITWDAIELYLYQRDNIHGQFKPIKGGILFPLESKTWSTEKYVRILLNNNANIRLLDANRYPIDDRVIRITQGSSIVDVQIIDITSPGLYYIESIGSYTGEDIIRGQIPFNMMASVENAII